MHKASASKLSRGGYFDLVAVLEEDGVGGDLPDDDGAVVGPGQQDVGEGWVRLQNIYLVLVNKKSIKSQLKREKKNE